MSQNGITLPTTGTLTGLAMVQAVNNAHNDLASLFSGTSAPSSPVAYQLWADTTSGYLKQRNGANSAWNILCKLDQDGTAATQSQLYTAFSSSGSAPAFTLTTTPAQASLVAGQRFRVKFHAGGTTGSNTLTRDGLATKNLMQYNASGSKVPAVVVANMLSDVEYDGTDYVILDPLPSIGMGLRNRIINGNGWIDQRNANAAVSVNSPTVTFGPDRWSGIGVSSAGVFNVQGSKSTYYNQGSGYQSSIYAQTTTADASPAAGSSYGIRYAIEGQDAADLLWGTANARAVTLSFWAYSTKTGTHCVAVSNGAGNRSYVATYAISSASTWEYKTVTIPGDTAGTWATDNTLGLRLLWNLGAGATYGTANANTWQAALYQQVTGAQQVIGTNSAVLAITDVQLELGSTATSFEKRPISVETGLCERYYEYHGAAKSLGFPCPSTGGFSASFWLPCRAKKRATLTFNWLIGSQVNVASYNTQSITDDGASIQVVGSAATNTTFTVSQASFSAEL